jgi:putative membrane protein
MGERTPAAYEWILLGTVLAVLVWSGLDPHHRFTWLLEVAPVLIGLPIVIATRRRFPLTPLLYLLLTIHAVILMVGGKYTYAEVPAGFWVRDWLGLARNHYDRLGHFAQGFVPAILAREILWRRSPLRGSRWLGFVVVSICLAFSAFYELIEWWTAAATGEAAEAFLGTQGDPWDTQWDMFLALLGAISALVLLRRVHDRQLASLRDDAVRAA